MFGQDLKSIREAKGIALKHISEVTRISLRHLQNLEEGQYARLPGGMYNRAFLRAYCSVLCIDPAPFLDRLGQDTSQVVPTPVSKPLPVPVSERRSQGVSPVLFWAFGFTLLALGLLWGRNWLDDVFAPYLARPPVVRMGERAQEFQGGAQNAGVPISPTARLGLRSEPRLSAASVVPPVSGSEFPEQEASKGALRLEFEVVESCWVSVQSDGENVLVRLLKPGEDVALAATDRFYLILGNAGGIHLKINGQPARSLGRPGEVVRMLINAQNVGDLLEKSVG